MSPLEASELRPGVVVRLDTTRVRELGGSATNAQASADEDRAVTGSHDFVVVAMDLATRTSTLLPLFPRSAPGSAPLDPRKLHGAEDWRGATWYYSRWQHWRIPNDAIVAASADDPASAGDRRTYAEGDVDALRQLENWASRNRCAFRPA